MTDVYLIDGTYELYRAHFGAPPVDDAAGRPVGATAGLIRSLVSLRRKGVTHAAIAFDTVIESFRNQLFEGYKTSEGIDPNLFRQFPLAEAAARALGLTVWPMVEFEADDALATAAAALSRQGAVARVLICSPDKDLSQCVDEERVILLDRRRSLEIDRAGVRDKFGVEPASIPDYLALVGDSADGIPGIARWGKKSAATVLAAYPRLEAIPRSADAWGVKPRGASALAQSLAEGYERALLYRTLATLRRDVPLDTELEGLRWAEPKGEQVEAAREVALKG